MKNMFLMLSKLNLVASVRPVFREDPPATPPPVPPVPEPTPAGKTYTQKEMDDASAKVRGSYERTAKAQATNFEKLANDQRLTAEERDSFRQQAEETHKLYKTEQQLKEDAVKAAKKDGETKYNAEKARADKAEKELEDLTVDIELTSEAAAAEELIPGQLKKHLKGDTKLVAELSEDGKPTGKKVVRVEFDDEVDGKPVKLLVPVKDAFVRMKAKPEKYGNFFKGVGVGGVGGNNGGGNVSAGSGMPTDTESYIAKRNAGRSATK